MEIEIRGKKYEAKELPYIKAIELDQSNRPAMVRSLFKNCLGMTDQEVDSLTIKEGKIAEKAVLEINGLQSEDFQKPTEKKE